MMPARYDRSLAENVVGALSLGSDLSFLVSDLPDCGDRNALDIQLRENNTLMYYHGTTRLLTTRFCLKEKKVHALATADKAYGKYPECQSEYAALMKSWYPKESNALHSAFRAYLPSAIRAADKRYYSNHKEGYWQNRLSIRFGRNWTPADPWLVVDRECVLGFSSTADKDRFYQSKLTPYMSVRNTLQTTDSVKWGKAKSKRFGDELDMLALDCQGRLLAIELKHGGNASGIYWGPLQVWAYRDAFNAEIDKIHRKLVKLARQKIALGLLPETAEEWVSRSKPSPVIAVLAVGNPNEGSSCQSKMKCVINEARRSCSGRELSLEIAKVVDADGSDLRVDVTTA
jgi:hypothetical protein